jgi:hypothetical protein
MNQEPTPRWALPVIALVVIGGAFIGGVIFGQGGVDQRDPTAALAPQVSSSAEEHEPHDGTSLPHPEIARIDLAELQTRLAAGTALLVDARSAEQYDAGHAEGALLLGSPQLDARLASLEAGALIVTYCT